MMSGSGETEKTEPREDKKNRRPSRSRGIGVARKKTSLFDAKTT
jgi:hypothetical protein